MPSGRNHSATYQARQALARSQGFASYNEKRRALEWVRRGPLSGMFRDTTLIADINSRKSRDLEAVREFYYGWKLNPDDYSIEGHKYAFMQLAYRMNREGMYENISDHSRWLWDRGTEK